MSLQDQANADVGAGYSEHNVYDSVKHLTVEERKALCQEQSLPYEVAVLNVTGELNVGNIIRSASLCGAQKVHILGRRKFDTRGSVGSTKYIDVVRVNAISDSGELDLEFIVEYFQDNLLSPIFVEQHTNAVGLDYIKLKPSKLIPCLVFGNEGHGIPTDLIEMFQNPTIVQLEQRGVIRSFNVGSTAAIVLYKMQELFT
jgi:tRNA G18 (ribose-2'-O)-methylase SpoU